MMSEEHFLSLQPGTLIAGRYEVIRCLGAGSMGLVYACKHKDLSGHKVAIKVLFGEVAQDKVAAARFRNEIFASYGVSHPNVVRAYEYIHDGDIVAYTMEYVGGGDLAERLSKGKGPLPINDCIKYLAQMCSGVQAIHDAGIVHRDLKPENILITEEGDVKIADFGIARTDQGPRLTEHGGVVGTIDYVSPEYMLNSHVDWRSDIYAIGILGYEMVTGESPFKGDSVYATMTKRLKTDPKNPRSLRSDCPEELASIILKAMSRNPEDRFQSAADMFYALQPLMSGRAVSSGSYLQISRRKGERYVGPTYQAELQSHMLAAEQASPDYVVSSGELQTNIRQREDTGPTLTNIARSISKDFLADDFSTGTHDTLGENNSTLEREPVRLESVLTYSDMITKGIGSTHSEITLNRGNIDQHRLRTLNQMADNFNRSVWVDMLTWVVAVLIGVGVGFAVLSVLFPNLIRDRSMESVILDARDEEL